jgi:signal transduction histidine kinase
MSLAGWVFRIGDTAARYPLGLSLLLCYVGTSVLLVGWLQLHWPGREPSHKFTIVAQIIDIGWPALICLFIETPYSLYFILFLFAIIAAAFRWGFIATLGTGLISAALLLFQAVMVGKNFRLGWAFAPIDPPRLLLRCGFLVISGTLLGCMAETEKELGAEVYLTHDLLSRARIGSRFSTAMQEVLSEFARVFRAQSIYEVVAQSSSGRAFKWEVPSLAKPSIHVREIAHSDADAMASYPHTFYIRKHRGGSCSVTALDEEGRRLDRSQVKGLQMPEPNADSLLVIGHEMGRDWVGRLVLRNVKLGPDREHELRFAQNVMRQVAPALYSVYLFRATRSRAEATERARVARELHDGAIQALIGIEMQVDVLRRRFAPSEVAGEMDRIQSLLRLEVLNLRELMQSMRPVDIGPHQFLDFVSGLVERFSRDTGISARFISELQEVSLPSATCREMARVVQEGLVNIRKHSKAQSAVVRFGAQNGSLKLCINDDGDGFPFAGRFTLGELDILRRGPAVIKERVRAVGGDMVIESTPGHGSRLEITIPQKGYESYG